jgi:hypothetical protein
VSSMPYGCKGCRCWPDDVQAQGDANETWYPNAMCPHHGLLADYTERRDTGVYTVIRNEPGPEAVSWPCDEGEDLRTGDAYTRAPSSATCPRCGRTYVGTSEQTGELLRLHLTAEHSTTEQERDDRPGLLAAVRRGLRTLVAPWRYGQL